jgi:WD40 repeat protein
MCHCAFAFFIHIKSFYVSHSLFGFMHVYFFCVVKVNSVQIHPLDANVLVCGGGGRARNISILDIRVISGSTNLSGGRTSGSKKGLLCDLLGHTAAINAAYVSPDGSSLVSVALDDTVALWSADMSIKTGDAGLVAPTSFTLAHSMRHNNKTGRWLSTLRPAFDPKCARTFVLGSLEMPRRIEVYDIEMGSSASKGIANKTTSKGSSSSLPLSMHDRPVLQDQQLESVCSRNAVHPSLRVVAGGNSSGRVHVFREKK